MSKDAPTLVFVHGGFCDADDWRGVTALLEASFSVIAENLPGHGGVSASKEATIAALAVALAQAIGPIPRAILVGHSMGCAVALEAALQSRNVPGLILIEGSMGAHADPSRTRAALEVQLDAGVESFLSRLADSWFADPVLQAQARKRLGGLGPTFARTLLLDAMRWDREDAARALRDVRTPLLAVQTTAASPAGRRSLSANETTAWLDLVKTCAPQAEIRVLEGTGHFPHVEESGVIANVIAQFARELSPL